MRLVATEYVSVDGVMDEPGKWSFPFWSEEAAKFKEEELLATDALLLGRLTYEGFAAAWPTMKGTGEFGERMNSIKKYVVSSTLKNPTWSNTTVSTVIRSKGSRSCAPSQARICCCPAAARWCGL